MTRRQQKRLRAAKRGVHTDAPSLFGSRDSYRTSDRPPSRLGQQLAGRQARYFPNQANVFSQASIACVGLKAPRSWYQNAWPAPS